jgi:hypothetical protein
VWAFGHGRRECKRGARDRDAKAASERGLARKKRAPPNLFTQEIRAAASGSSYPPWLQAQMAGTPIG